jgi:hypothetical protein
MTPDALALRPEAEARVPRSDNGMKSIRWTFARARFELAHDATDESKTRQRPIVDPPT